MQADFGHDSAQPGAVTPQTPQCSLDVLALGIRNAQMLTRSTRFVRPLSSHISTMSKPTVAQNLQGKVRVSF